MEDRLALISDRPANDRTYRPLRLPFSDAILNSSIPPKFKPPSIDPYDGETDPLDHVEMFKMHLMIQSASDAVLCKAFPATLKGSAREWFSSLSPGSISSFDQLCDLFLSHFVSSRRQKKTSASLLDLSQRNEETLRDYVRRFNREVREVSDLDTAVALAAFRHNVKNQLLRISLSKRPPENYPDLLRRCEKFINVEEGLRPAEQRNQFLGEKRKVNQDQDPKKLVKSESGQRDSPPSKFAKYTPLSTTLTGVLNEIKNDHLLSIPNRLKTPDNRKNKKKFCRYHNDHGHTTDECRSLKDEIETLIRNGHLAKFVKDKATEGPTQSPKESTQEANPVPEAIVHTISGGPTGGSSNNSRKAYIREVASVRGPIQKGSPGQSITFSDEDYEGVKHPHCDPLVVTLSMANHQVKRVLVDNGSSVDVLFLDAFDKLKITKSRLKPVGYTLHGFTGAPVRVEGTITLDITVGTHPFIKTVPLDFMVVNVKSAYNVILGRPGLAALEAVPSALHMKIKFPTPTGVGEVRGDQESSRSCYTTSLDQAVLLLETLDPREIISSTDTVDKLEIVPFFPNDPARTFQISAKLPEETKMEIDDCIRANSDLFAEYHPSPEDQEMHDV